mmetsp:Transcript_40808/g.66174  ORF Transcript_40808/g.66174 Transcript_40808/m.66174 type:complete len:533 (-) Transcript_40808:361-1959(-)
MVAFSTISYGILPRPTGLPNLSPCVMCSQYTERNVDPILPTSFVVPRTIFFSKCFFGAPREHFSSGRDLNRDGSNDLLPLEIYNSGAQTTVDLAESPIQLLLRMSKIKENSLTLMDQWQLTEQLTEQSLAEDLDDVAVSSSLLENITFSFLAHKQIAIINAVFKACIGARKEDLALKLLAEMPASGQIPDSSTFKIVIDGLGKAGRLGDALNVFATMFDFKVTPTAGVYRSVIRACLRNEQLELALQALDAMKSEGVTPDEYIYRLLGAAMCRAGRIEHAFVILEEEVAAGIRPELYNMETLLEASIHTRNLCGATRVLQILESYTLRSAKTVVRAFDMAGNLSGCLDFLKRTSKYADQSAQMAAHNALLDACVATCNLELTIEVLSEMGSKGIPPHEGAFGSMVKVFSQSGDYSNLKRLWCEIRYTDSNLSEDAFFALAESAIKAHDAETVSDVLDFASWSRQLFSTRWYSQLLATSALEGQQAIFGSVMGAVQRQGVSFDSETTSKLLQSCQQGGVLWPRTDLSYSLEAF